MNLELAGCGNENPIRTLGDCSKPSHEGYGNTIKLPIWNNVVPLRSNTIRLVKNRCSFNGVWSEDLNQHLKDFLKLVDLLDLDGSITTWEDLTTRFLAQFFPLGRTAKLRNDILMFQQHHGESLFQAWTRFKNLLQKDPHHGIDLWLQYCIEDPEQAFVEYTSLRTDEVGGKWYTFKPEQNNLGDTYNPSWKSHPNLSMAEEEKKEREGDPKDTNTIAYIEEQRDTPLLERKDIAVVGNLGSNKYDEGIKWLDVEEPLDLVDTSHKFIANTYIDVDLPMNIMSLAYYKSIRKNGYKYRGRKFVRLGRDMHVSVGNMSYIIDFVILENIETNIELSLSHVIFGRPFIEIVCLAINKKHGLMTFTDETKEITFKTPYKEPERSELSSEGHDLISSRVILSEDDYDRGCRKPSDLEDGFYKDNMKLKPEYLTRMNDEGEVT
nr:hypothetical protein [Tanacetum cinerariifolium]